MNSQYDDVLNAVVMAQCAGQHVVLVTVAKNTEMSRVEVITAGCSSHFEAEGILRYGIRALLRKLKIRG